MQTLNDQLQRLVDGELSARHIDQVLETCEAQPEAWRELALRFVERQQIESWLEDRRVDVPAVQIESCEATAYVSTPPSTRPVSRRLALAAGIVLAIGVGFGLGRLPDGEPANPLTAELSQPLSESIGAINSAPDETSPRLANGSNNLVGPAQGDTESRASSLPDRSSEVTDEPKAIQPLFVVEPPVELGPTNALRHEWLKQGFIVRETPEWVKYNKDGKQLAVRNPRYDLQYVGGLAYQ